MPPVLRFKSKELHLCGRAASALIGPDLQEVPARGDREGQLDRPAIDGGQPVDDRPVPVNGQDAGVVAGTADS